MLDNALNFKYEQTGVVDVGLKIRKAISLPPVMGNNDEVLQNYNEFLEKVANLALETINLDPAIKIIDPVQTIERIHFYLVYMGSKFDRVSQRLVNELYTNSLVNFDRADLVNDNKSDPNISNSPNNLNTPNKKIKIGFVSKFFGGKKLRGTLRPCLKIP